MNSIATLSLFGENDQSLIGSRKGVQTDFESSEYAKPLSKLKPLTTGAIYTPVFRKYWEFAVERQLVFFKRLAGHPAPWTEDSIIRQFKFTNVYRASDRVSQFLIQQVIYNGSQEPDELFFRILLFKIFNRISTWKQLLYELGEITWEKYRFEKYDKILSNIMARGEKVYSAAYLMSSGNNVFGYPRKHSNHLKVIEMMMKEKVPEKIKESNSLEEVYKLLKTYPTLGEFLAFQFAIDLNYSQLIDFDEMSFVVAGPGALDGISKCFETIGNLTPVDVIREVTLRQEEFFEAFELKFPSLWGRPMQLIDCQNVFCEIEKYSRKAFPHRTGRSDRTKIKQSFRENSEAIDFWYPPKWHLNELINQRNENVP